MHSNPLISVARSKASALFAALALVLVVTLTLAGCSSDKSEETATEAKKDPSSIRVVALDWRYEEILHALGITPVGIVEIGKSKEPQTLKGKLEGVTSVGQAKQPNLEVIQSLEPDLILASPTRQAAIMD